MVRRIGSILMLLLSLSLVAFALVDLSSGSRAEYILGDYADEESVEKLEMELGLDGSFISRYLRFLGNFITLDWGEDLKGNSILELVSWRFSVTLELSMLSMALAIGLSLLMSILSVRNGGSFFDVFSDLVSIVVFSLPSFLLAILLVLAFPHLPSSGFYPMSYSIGLNLKHMLLPVLSTALMHFALLSRVLKRSLKREMKKPYARAALAYGERKSTLSLRVVLRPASTPYIALLSESFGAMMAGSAVIESVFSLPGLGSLFVSAALSRDVELSVILMMLFFLMVSFSSIVSELVMARLDPRTVGGRS